MIDNYVGGQYKDSRNWLPTEATEVFMDMPFVYINYYDHILLCNTFYHIVFNTFLLHCHVPCRLVGGPGVLTFTVKAGRMN